MRIKIENTISTSGKKENKNPNAHALAWLSKSFCEVKSAEMKIACARERKENFCFSRFCFIFFNYEILKRIFFHASLPCLTRQSLFTTDYRVKPDNDISHHNYS